MRFYVLISTKNQNVIIENIMKIQRTDPHKIATKATDIIRGIINRESALFRELTGRDYGIDGIIELFDEGRVTGKIAFLQCKGTGKAIEPLKSDKTKISCGGISEATVAYAEQNNVIMFIVYASIEDNSLFYYASLSDVITREHKEKIENGQDTITVRIPICNNSLDNMPGFLEEINKFYLRRSGEN